ncbi:MAG TPA: hypothetical protein VKU41_28470 [Polyangiaceae bacterium]|nr:hypothetical protein [Polyangiaceae bacterium]
MKANPKEIDRAATEILKRAIKVGLDFSSGLAVVYDPEASDAFKELAISGMIEQGKSRAAATQELQASLRAAKASGRTFLKATWLRIED